MKKIEMIFQSLKQFKQKPKIAWAFLIGLFSGPAFALNVPAAPDIDGATSGDTNWFTLYNAIVENAANSMSVTLGVVVFLVSACVLIAGLVMWTRGKEGAGAFIAGGLVVGAISVTVVMFAVNEVQSLIS